MSTRLKYILACCLFLSSFTGISKDILIDAGFSSTEIYNTLTCSKQIVGKDLKFDLTMKNISGKEQQLYLSFINPTIDKIVIYNNRDIVILGDLIPFTKRVFKHTNFVYPVFLNKDSIVHLHIAVTQKPLQRLNFRLNLATENTFIKTTNHDNFFNGIFYGILFMYLLLLICFYIFSKSNFFTIYLMINFFMLLLFLLFNGTGYQFFLFYSATILFHAVPQFYQISAAYLFISGFDFWCVVTGTVIQSFIRLYQCQRLLPACKWCLYFLWFNCTDTLCVHLS